MAMTTAGMRVGISRLQVPIHVHDRERAARFYRDRLGLPLLFTTGGMAFLDCGGVRLMLTRPEKPEFDHASSVLYFNVPEIKSAHRAIEEQGVEFEGEPHRLPACPTTIGGWPSFVIPSRICRH